MLIVAILTITAPPVQTQPTLAQTAPTVELMNSLPVEHRRYLLYLYARLAKPAVVEILADHILKEVPTDRQTYLVLCSMYLELRMTEKALLTGLKLAKMYPTDDQAIYFLAAAHYQAGHFQESNRILRDVKDRAFRGRLYPYETDLASAAANAGDWYRAMLSYQELLRNHSLGDELRLQARVVLEDIYRQHLPQATFQHEVVWLNEGLIHRSSAEYTRHMREDYRLFVGLSHQEQRINRAFGLNEQDDENWDGQFGIEKVWSRKWSTRLWVGGWSRGPMYGLSVTRNIGTGRDLTWGYRGEERVREGLFIEALDGRQHRLIMGLNFLHNQKWLSIAEGYVREVHVDDYTLGYGVGLTYNLEHMFIHRSPDFRVGYKGQIAYFKTDTDLPTSYVERFVRAPDPGEIAPSGPAPRRVRRLSSDPRQALIETLVPDYIHRHGLYVRYEDQLSGFIYYGATVGADYALELGSVEYYGQGGFRVYPRKSIELRLEGGYSSSSTTSGLGSEQWNVIAGLKLWF